jgi:hypothetical protein
VLQVQKYGAAALLLALNAFFMYYILLTGFRKGTTWQYQYLLSCLAQMAVDLLLFETVECAWLNFSVPQFVNEEVAVAAETLKHLVQTVAGDEEYVDLEDGALMTENVYVNAPVHLFVSVKVAQAFPQLLESLIVSAYQSQLPGKISTTWPHCRQGRPPAQSEDVTTAKAGLLRGVTRSLTLVLLVFIATPFAYQRIALRLFQPLFFTAIGVLFYSIAHSLPAIVVLSAVLGAALVYSMCSLYDGASDSSKESRVHPVGSEEEVPSAITKPVEPTAHNNRVHPVDSDREQPSPAVKASDPAGQDSPVHVVDSDEEIPNAAVNPPELSNFDGQPTLDAESELAAKQYAKAGEHSGLAPASLVPSQQVEEEHHHMLSRSTAALENGTALNNCLDDAHPVSFIAQLAENPTKAKGNLIDSGKYPDRHAPVAAAVSMDAMTIGADQRISGEDSVALGVTQEPVAAVAASRETVQPSHDADGAIVSDVEEHQVSEEKAPAAQGLDRTIGAVDGVSSAPTAIKAPIPRTVAQPPVQPSSQVARAKSTASRTSAVAVRKSSQADHVSARAGAGAVATAAGATASSPQRQSSIAPSGGSAKKGSVQVQSSRPASGDRKA